MRIRWYVIVIVIALSLVSSVIVWAGGDQDFQLPSYDLDMLEAVYTPELIEASNVLVGILDDEIVDDLELASALDAGCTVLRILSSEPIINMYNAVVVRDEEGLLVDVNYDSILPDGVPELLYGLGFDEDAALAAYALATDFRDRFSEDELKRIMAFRAGELPGALQTTSIFVCTASKCPEDFYDQSTRKETAEGLARVGIGGSAILAGMTAGNVGVVLFGATLALDGLFDVFF